MKESVEFLILDTIKKHASIVPLFTAGYSYSKVLKWVQELEKAGEIQYDEMEQRVLSKKGRDRWKLIKKKKSGVIILPLVNYKVEKLNIDEIYLP